MAVRFDRVLVGFGARVVLDRVSFNLAASDRTALVGANGAGKSTILRLIIGELQVEAGVVALGVPPTDVGLLRQEFAAAGAATVGQFLHAARPELAALEATMVRNGSLPPEQLDAFDAAGGWLFVARRDEVLRGLGLVQLDLQRRPELLSGGEQTRLALAQLLLRQPLLLLLDEPTNHLDLQALLWLERYLASYRGTLLLVSHDRVFLDRVTTRTLMLEQGRLEAYAGTYSAYLHDSETRRARQLAAYHRQQEEVARLRQSAAKLEGGARAVEARTIDFAARAKAARVARGATVLKRRIERELDQHRLEKPKQGWSLKLDLQPTGDTGQVVLAARGLTVTLGGKRLLDAVDIDLRRGERVALVGQNGAGKTTLLRVLLGDLAPDAGSVSRGPSVRIGSVEQERAPLDPDATVLEIIREAGECDELTARSFAHFLLFSGDAVFTPTGRLSAGERARLSIGALVLGQVNTLVIDEPTNHLDLDAQGVLADVLAQYRGALLVASHNRAFLQAIAIDRVLELANGRVRVWYALDDYLEALATRL